MSNHSKVSEHMVTAEARIHGAMGAHDQAARLDAVMRAYWHTPQIERDAFVAVLAARLTLIPPQRSV